MSSLRRVRAIYQSYSLPTIPRPYRQVSLPYLQHVLFWRLAEAWAGRGMGWQELTWMDGEATAEDLSNLDYSVGWQRHELSGAHLDGQRGHS